MTWAASMGYYAAFSFFPLILVLLAGVGYVLRFSQQAQLQQEKLVALIGEQTSPALAHQLDTLLNGVQNNAGIGGPIGLITLILGAIGIFTQTDSAFDRIWKIEADPERKTGWLGMIRNVLLTRLRAFLMLVGLGLLVIVAFVAGTVVWSLVHFARGTPLAPLSYHLAGVGVSAALNTLFFTLVYRLLPKKPVRWVQAIEGGLVAGVAWEIGRQLMTLFLVGNSYTAYGVVGSFILMMLWFYYASNVLLFGAEFVEVCSRAATNRKIAAASGPQSAKQAVRPNPTAEDVAIGPARAPEPPPSIRPRWRG
jgi:membrane protein